MTKIMKLCAVMLCASIMLSGCGLVSVNEDRYNSQVVATVGAQDISVAEYTEMINLYSSYYQVSMTDPEQAEYAQQIKDAAFQALVDDKVKLNKASELGYADLTAEEEAEIKQNVDDWLDSQIDSIKSQNEDQQDDEEFVQSELVGYLRSLGFTDVEHVYTEQRKEYIQGKLFEYMTADASATDEEVRAYYDQTVSEQKATFDADPVQYETAQQNEVTPLLYMPEGYRHVKHILIGIPTETTDTLRDLLSAGDAAYDAQLIDALVPIENLSQEVLDRALAGEDFDELIAEYGQDPGMMQEPGMTEGYLICDGSNMIPEFLAASMALENPGDISGLVGGMYGYHIVKLIDIVPSSTVEYTDELKEELRAEVLTESQRNHYNTLMELWRSDYEVKYNDSVYKSM